MKIEEKINKLREEIRKPVKRCSSNGKPGFKWGDEGKCFTYTPGNEESRNRARERALAQGRAIEANS